jgi:deazaflavin-dependent oxidoreductase (nitroreductase family)
VLGPLAERLPGFGVVVHTGRRSGRTYRTPIMLFARPGGDVAALTYGPSTDWVRNVLASGSCTLETRGRMLRLTRPRLVHDTRRRLMPVLVRLPLAVLGVSNFLELEVESNAA